ncbi:MAG: hypothetical protein ACI4L6_00555 [Candidatus Onthoplasma sp.]
MDKLGKKLSRANELRKEQNKSMRELEKTIDEWWKKSAKAKTPNERLKIDKEYQSKYNKADKQEDITYKRYSNFVTKNFDDKIVIDCLGDGDFGDKIFITRLSKALKNNEHTSKQSKVKATGKQRQRKKNTAHNNIRSGKNKKK